MLEIGSLIAAIVLYAASVILDRFAEGRGSGLTLGFATVFFYWFIFFSVLSIFIEPSLSPVPGSYINELKEIVSVFGGWSKFFAALYLIGTGSLGVSLLISLFIDIVDSFYYTVLFVLTLCVGLLFLIGFIPFFEGVDLILGIVGTIIGITVGIKKLMGRGDGKSKLIK